MLRSRFKIGFLMIVLAGAATGSTCSSGVGVRPFGQISGVQLFDEPNYTMAISIEDAVNNPSAISKVNWVFGDGSGFVEGAAGRTSITYRYDAPGTYNVIAYIFDANNELETQLTNAITVVADNDNSNPPPEGDLPGPIRSANPADGATNLPNDTLLTWANGTNATSNDVYLGTDESGVDSAVHSSAEFKGNQEASDFDPGDLDPDTEYFWRVDSINDAGVSKGVVRSFKTAEAPGKAETPTPANGSVSARADQILAWVAGDNTNNHDVYFGKDPAAVLTADTETPDIFKGNQSGATFNPSDEDAAIEGELLPATTYYWRIDEHGPGGVTTGDLFTFTVRPAPPAITSPVPANNAVNVEVQQVLGWSGSSSIENYDVYFGVDSADVADATRDSPEFMGNQTAKLFDPGDLAAEFTYYWRVDTRGPGGTSKGIVFTFTTAQAPAQVVGPFSPANNAGNASVDQILSWSSGVGGITNQFEVFFSSTQSQVINGAAAALVSTQDVSMTSFDLPNILTPATQYFWRVDALGPGGRTEGTVQKFTTGALPGQATNPNPLNDAIDVALDVNLTWTAGVGSASSDVYFGTDEDVVLNATTSDAAFKGNQAGTTFDVEAELGAQLNTDTDYFWRIDARSPGGAKKGLTWHFKTGVGVGKATTPDPANTATGVSVDVVLSWTPAAGITTHNVYLSTDLAAVTNAAAQVNPPAGAPFLGTFNGTLADPPGSLTANTQYYWRVDSVSGTTVTKGDVWRFTTLAPPAQASGPSPINGATNVAITATLNWSAVAMATSYDVYFGTNQGAVAAATTASPEFQGNQPGTSLSPAGMIAATQYFWRVDAKNAAGTTTGTVWSFTTAP